MMRGYRSVGYRRQPSWLQGYFRKNYGIRQKYVRTYVPTRRTKRRMTRRARRAASAPGADERKKMTGTSHGDKYVLAQADPFDENVDGVKIPDANAQPSTPLKAEDTIDLLLDPTWDSRCYAFNPTCQAVAVAATRTGASTWTWAAAFGNTADSVKLAQLRADFDLFRTVAHGIRITSGLAPTAATGFVHVCVYSQALYNQNTWTYPTSVSQMQAVPGYRRIPIGRLTSEGLTIANRCMDVTSQRYTDTDSPVYANAGTMEFQTPLQWASIIVAVTGAPVGSVPLAIESIIHFECIPRVTSVSTATPAASFNPGALGAGSAAQSKTSPSYTDGERTQRKAKAIANAIGGAMKAGGAGKVTGPKRTIYRLARNLGPVQGIRNSAGML